MLVRDIMTTDLITVDKDRNLKEVLALMRQHNITKVPVVEAGRLVGVITDGRIADKLGRIHNRDIQTSTLHASSVMEKDFLVAHPDEPLETLLKDVGEPGLTMVPVVQGHKLVGVVTKADLLRLVDIDQPVSAIMKTELRSVGAEERLVHARRLLLDHDIARLPVLRNGRIEGIIAEHEIATAFAMFKEADAHVQKASIRDLQVGPYMRRQVVTCTPETTVREAARIMMDGGVGGLPVVAPNGVIQGIVTRTDLIRAFLEHQRLHPRAPGQRLQLAPPAASA